MISKTQEDVIHVQLNLCVCFFVPYVRPVTVMSRSAWSLASGIPHPLDDHRG